jgi:hypothetical protein
MVLKMGNQSLRKADIPLVGNQVQVQMQSIH